MSEIKRWETKPLECWGKAKEFSKKYYQEFAEADQKGKIRWVGAVETLDSLVAGLGDDFAHIVNEAYGASIGNNPRFSRECQEAMEARGFARDLCAYMRNYCGSVFLDKYAFGGEFPKPAFAFTDHFCCLHGKWMQLVAEYLNIPIFTIDVAAGPSSEMKSHPQRVDYIVNQCLDAIEWLQKVTGREYDDEKLIEAVYNEARSTSLWAEICELNKAVPAPLDEKSMYTLYVLAVLHRSSKEVADFYEELKAEVEDRVRHKIAAVPTERFRIFHDSQPPWSFLKIFRYLEQFGVATMGSFYGYTLMGSWDFTGGHVVPSVPPHKQGISLKSREEAVRFTVEWNLKKLIWDTLMRGDLKVKYILSMLKDWNVDGMIMHFNRGCEGTSLFSPEVRAAVSKAGIPVMSYEGNMADDSEFDEAAAVTRVDAFMENLGLKKLKTA